MYNTDCTTYVRIMLKTTTCQSKSKPPRQDIYAPHPPNNQIQCSYIASPYKSNAQDASAHV